MTAKGTENQSRRDFVLGIVVNEYIKTVNPVSSGYIVQEHVPDLSPATIRNILAELEKDGYLTHPHTSAGRVPTSEGYRYYVDNLMSEIELLGEEKTRIKEEYQKEVKDLELTLEKTSQVISDITHYTSIVSVDGRGNQFFCKGTGYVVQYADSHDLNKIRDILKTLEEKEQILEMINRRLKQKIQIYIGHEIACSDMGDCSLAVSPYKTGSGLTGRLAILGPTRMDYQKVVSALDYFSELMAKNL
jgi:transcriptional regulator of heat shock response